MAREASQRVNHLLNTAEQLRAQGQRRDALDMCDAALTIARAADLDCSQINKQRETMLGQAGRFNTGARDLR